MNAILILLITALSLSAQSGQQQLMLGLVDQPLTPVDSPGGGSYSSTQSVTITDATATFILYTLTGSAPACPGTGTLYSGAFNISTTTTLKAIGCNGITGGGVLTSVYTISGGGISVFNSSCTNFNPGDVGPDTTPSINTTGATIVAGFVPWLATSIGTIKVTDNKSNGNAILLTKYTNAGNPAGVLFYWLLPTVGTGHTFTVTALSGSGNLFDTICVSPISGAVGTFDSGSDEGNSANSGTTCQQSASLTVASGDIIIAGVGSRATGTQAINSSFTIDAQTATISGGGFAGAVGHLISTGSAVQPTWSGLLSGMVCGVGAFH